MADRTDIDALLIGALYGELTPADEARLAAHLESHPADRSALDSLGQTRARVRDHRLLADQVEPPHAISARLLQEAARSAPRGSDRDREAAGWFHRLARTLLAHPALAAAAMFVLVVGVAGALYARHGDRFAVSTESIGRDSPAPQAETTAPPSPAAPPLPADPAPPAAVVAGARAGNADLAPEPPRGASESEAEPAPTAPRKPLAKAAKGGVSGIELRSPAPPTVKDLDEQATNYYAVKRDAPAKRAPVVPAEPSADDVLKAELDSAPADAERVIDKQRISGAAPADAAPVIDNQRISGAALSKSYAQPPPAAPVQAPVTATAAPAPPAEDKSTLAWAQNQHDRVRAHVRSSQCTAAADLATEIYTRAPTYYAANVANDRAMQPCQAALRAARDLVDRRRGAPARSR